jgi:hypothetical protein
MWHYFAGFSSVLLIGGVLAQDEPAEAQRFLEQMRARAEATQVTVTRDEKEVLAKLHDKPVFRYSDAPRRIEDATLWVWLDQKRPVALQKIEASNARNRPSWTHCFASLAEDTLSVSWPGDRTFETTKPGVTFATIPNAPKPAATAPARQLQLRELVRRFSATITIDPKKNVTEELRLLPRPVFTYGADAEPVQAGAIFGFAANGTNPDAYLLIELRSGVWRSGWTRMTTGGLAARLDDKEVWTAEFVPPNPKGFGTWTFFFDPRE